MAMSPLQTGSKLFGNVKRAFMPKTLHEVQNSEHFQRERRFLQELSTRDVFTSPRRVDSFELADRASARTLKENNLQILADILSANSKSEARRLKKLFYRNNKLIDSHSQIFDGTRARAIDY